MSDNDISTNATGPSWVQNDPFLGTIFAFTLIGLYVLPVYIISVVAWTTGGLQEDSLLFEWFAAFIRSADSTLNQYHKVLMPILTGLSVIVMSGRLTRSTIALAGFLIISWFVTVNVSVYFEMGTTLSSLKGLSTNLDPALAKSFFSRIQETLMAYFALLLGLGAVGSAKKGK